jgi:hypothetical protein
MLLPLPLAYNVMTMLLLLLLLLLFVIFCCVSFLCCAACEGAALAYAQRSKAGVLVCAELAAFAWVQDVAHCALGWCHATHGDSSTCDFSAAADFKASWRSWQMS